MAIQYVHDQDGKRTAVIVPIEEWEALQEDVETSEHLSDVDRRDRDEAYAELDRGESWDQKHAMRHW